MPERETGVPPKRLELEITESLLISDTDEVFGKLTRLRELGVRIVMDDFGTGYSSFNYLARFAFDKIKIDRQFVRNMTRDPRCWRSSRASSRLASRSA